jgi:hypothetical protein
MNERSESNKYLWVGAIFVLALTFAAHFRALQGQFVDWDDTIHITRNVAIRGLSLDNLRLMFAHPIAKLYCPLTWLSFAFDYQIWGQAPFGYHLTNLLLHLANTLLVLVLVRKVLRDRFQYATAAALLTAAIFGVHPLGVESVAWATERKDVLFAFFYLGALIAYGRWLGNHKWRMYWICFGLFVASAFSKSTAVSFPIVLLIIDHWLVKRKAWGEKVPFFAVSLIVTTITLAVQAGGPVETVATPEFIPLCARWPGRVLLVVLCEEIFLAVPSFGGLCKFRPNGLDVPHQCRISRGVCYRNGIDRRQPSSLSGVAARMALLSCHALANHRFGPQRRPCRRRSLFVSAANWIGCAPEHGCALVNLLTTDCRHTVCGESDRRRSCNHIGLPDRPTWRCLD